MKPYLVTRGFVASGFERVRDAFSRNLTEKVDKGGSFAVYYKGNLVVNLWGGYADEEARRLWKEDTITCYFSTTKSASAIVIAHMVDRGLLKYEDKVAKHWPEFAANQKGEITLEQLISNKGGLSCLEEDFQLSWMRDNPKKFSDMFAKQKPLWTPGEGHGYHPINFGLYLDQIVQRVDPRGRSLGDYFKDEIAKPFDLDYCIGLPKPLQYRAARLHMLTDPKDYVNEMMKNFQGDPYILQLMLKNPTDFRNMKSVQDPDIMELQCGSTHGFGTAAAAAKLQAILANGGEHHGRRLLSPQLISRLQKPLTYGMDKCQGVENIFSLGTMILPATEGDDVTYMFGHGGYGGQLAMSDCKYQVGWAYVTNYLDPKSTFQAKTRVGPLYRALYDCLHTIENVSVRRKTYNTYSELMQSRKSHL